MAAIALAGNALAIARVAAAMDAGIELLISASKASKAIAQAQQEGRDISSAEMDGFFASDDAEMQALHAVIAAKAAAPGAVDVPPPA